MSVLHINLNVKIHVIYQAFSNLSPYCLAAEQPVSQKSH